MNVLLVIDHFGSGGAQRQIVELACGLERRGHSVEMFAYFPGRDFFRAQLDEHRISVHEFAKGRGFQLSVVRRLRQLVASRGTDVIVSFLNSPNIYAELAQVGTRRARLVVSERTSYHDDKSRTGAWLRRALHALADHVVANSHTQCEWLRRHRWLSHKVSCIYNGVDASRFASQRSGPAAPERMRLVAVGRIGPEKNAINLVRALELFRRDHGYVPQVSWVGGADESPAGRAYRGQLDALLASHPEVRGAWRWLGLETDMPRLLSEHHALIHPSLYEGLPNVVCEALAAGMPVLVSRVCDHPRLVADRERGFLFEPLDPASMAAAIRDLAGLSPQQWEAFSRNASLYAARELDVELMISAYEKLLASLLSKAADLAGVSGQDCR